MKPIIFLGDRRECVRAFPADARARVGFELREVQMGNDPTDWKPMKTIGPGVREIRLRAASGVFRVLYLVVTEKAVVVLHAFQKKSQQTPTRNIDLATRRLKTFGA